MAKGEVVECQYLVNPCEKTLTIKSHEMSGARSSETTLKEYRDLSIFIEYFAGAHSIKDTTAEQQSVDPRINSVVPNADTFPIEGNKNSRQKTRVWIILIPVFTVLAAILCLFPLHRIRKRRITEKDSDKIAISPTCYMVHPVLFYTRRFSFFYK
ncbi:hypothetical protein AgCh_001520 [Apium graveolens]